MKILDIKRKIVESRLARGLLVLLAMPLIIYGFSFVFAENYGIDYDAAGVDLGQSNVIEDANLIDSLFPLIKYTSGDSSSAAASVSGAGWQEGYMNYSGCHPYHYIAMQNGDSIDESDNLSFVVYNNSYEIRAQIKNISFESEPNARQETYAIGVTDSGGFIVTGFETFNDAACSDSKAINLLTPDDGNKIFVELVTTLHKRGESNIFSSGEQYLGITDIDAAQSYKILNSGNELNGNIGDGGNMYTKDLDALQPTDSELRNKFVAAGNYIYSQYSGGNSFDIWNGNAIYVPLTLNTQNEGLDIVFGFAGGAGSSIEYYSKKYTVEYESDENGEIVAPALQEESVFSGDNPTGSTPTPNSGYHFTNCWTANVGVTLEDGNEYPADTHCLTPEQVQQVIVTEDIIFTAHHDPNGRITVTKADSETGECVASFDSQVTFTLTKDNQTIYANTPISNCQLTWEVTEYGTYEISENYSGDSYTPANPQTVTISNPNNLEVTVNFVNTPKKESLTINKIDAETGECTVLSKNHSLNGSTFKITNASSGPIYYQDRSVAVGGEIATVTLANDACSIKIDDLPYGTYKVKEITAAEGYVLNDEEYTLSIPSNPTVTIPNQPIRGDLAFIKKDKNSDAPLANVVFKISHLDANNNAIESHLAVTNANGVIDTRSSFNPHSNSTNGYDSLYEDESSNIPFAGYGTWFGLDSEDQPLSVSNDLGALPYGRYLIQEMACESNNFCYGIEDQKQIITISQNNQVVDLDEWNNDCAVFGLETEATDAKDGNKFVEAINDAKITDHIRYCARTNRTFTIKGILMDKATSEPLLINGETVENSIEVTPENECEEVDMEFSFDGTGLGGKEIVVYENLYYDNELIISHEDLSDELQTVEMVYLRTMATNRATGEKNLPLDEDVTIVDVVEYCVKPGQEYTIKGVLMDKTTGEKLLVNNLAIENESSFTPEEACGQLEMSYTLNTANLGGAELVIFDSFYRGDELILEHSDINNADETVNVDIPAPNTGMITKDDSSSAGRIAVSILGVALGAVFVFLPVRLHRKKVDFSKVR